MPGSSGFAQCDQVLWQCFVISAFILLSAPGSLSQDSCTSGFMDRDLLTARATKIPPGQPAASPNTLDNNNRFLIIPGMNFSCSGTITSLKLGVNFRNITIGDHLELHLWRMVVGTSGQLRYRYVDSSRRVVSLGAGSFSPNGVNEVEILPALNFQSGNVIAVFQPSNSRTRLYYSTQVPHPAGLNVAGATQPTTSVRASDYGPFNGYLLLRPVTNAADSCLNGFFSNSELVEQTRSVNINGVFGTSSQQRLFPDIRFTCNGFITKWIVGAAARSSGDRMPELQIWRRTAGTMNSYTKTNSSLIVPNEVSGSPNVHEFIPATPLQFNEGDILGIHQPLFNTALGSSISRFVLYYQDNTGPENYGRTNADDPDNSFNIGSPGAYDYPLVSVEITTALPILPSTTHVSAVIISSSVQTDFKPTFTSSSAAVPATKTLLQISSTFQSVSPSCSLSTVIEASLTHEIDVNGCASGLVKLDPFRRILSAIVASSVLVILVITATVTALIIILIWKRRSHQKTSKHSVSSEQVHVALQDNVCYTTCTQNSLSKNEIQVNSDVLLQQNKSRIQQQPIASTVKDKEYMDEVYDYAKVTMRQDDVLENKATCTVQLQHNVCYVTSSKENHHHQQTGVQSHLPIVLQQNDAYGTQVQLQQNVCYVTSSIKNSENHQQQWTDLLTQDTDDNYI